MSEAPEALGETPGEATPRYIRRRVNGAAHRHAADALFECLEERVGADS